MKYSEYYKKLTHQLSQMSRNELESLILEAALKQSEGMRDAFLKKLSGFHHTNQTKTDPEPFAAENQIEKTLQAIRDFTQKWNQIPEDDFYLESEPNEKWDDWYNFDEPEYFYSDPSHIVSLINEGLKLVRTASDLNMTEQALILLQWMLETEIMVFGDSCDSRSGWEILSSEDFLCENPAGLAKTLMQDFFNDQGLSVVQRVQILADFQYDLREHYDISTIEIQDLLETSALPDEERENLIKQWTYAAFSDYMNEDFTRDFYGKRNLRILLEAALNFIHDIPVQHALLQKFGTFFPQLLLPYYLSRSSDYTTRQKQETLNMLIRLTEKDQQVQAKLFDLLAGTYQDNTGRYDPAGTAALEKSLQTAPTLQRYAALVTARINDDLHSVIQGLNLQESYDNLERTMLFFEGDIGPVEQSIKKDNQHSYGCSHEAVLLLGLLLESGSSTPSMQQLTASFLSHSDLWPHTPPTDYSFLFKRLAGRLKLSQAQKNEILDQTGKWIRSYCESVTASQSRDQYFHCAQLVRAWESAGEHIHTSNEIRTSFDLVSDLTRRYPRFRKEMQKAS